MSREAIIVQTWQKEPNQVRIPGGTIVPRQVHKEVPAGGIILTHKGKGVLHPARRNHKATTGVLLHQDRHRIRQEAVAALAVAVRPERILLREVQEAAIRLPVPPVDQDILPEVQEVVQDLLPSQEVVPGPTQEVHHREVHHPGGLLQEVRLQGVHLQEAEEAIR